MGSRLIESGSLAKFWSDWRSAIKVIANFLQPFGVKQALHSNIRNVVKWAQRLVIFSNRNRSAENVIK